MLDEHARMLLPALADRCHVWLVESEENTKAAKDYWEQASPVEDHLASGVTTFAPGVESLGEALDVVLELVESHHGEHAHDPPLNEILVVGPEPLDVIFEVLREWGFTDIQSSAAGVIGKRE